LTSDEPISATQRIQVSKTDSDVSVSDHVVGEEPLEIRIDGGAGVQQLAITMRTPGADIELGAGFLWSEGLLRNREDLIGITTCKDKELSPREQENVIVARVVADAPAVARTLERRFTILSACGVCGSTR
jgi:FdhD protein